MGFFSLSLLIILVWYLFIHLENKEREKDYRSWMKQGGTVFKVRKYEVIEVKKEGE